MSDNLRFKDKVALVTGAGSGIGRALALALAQEGASLILAARSREKLSQAAGQAQPHAQNEILVQPTDVSDRAQVEKLAAAAQQAFGGVDILANCAGLGYGGPVLASDPAQAEEMIRVNFYGLYLVTRLCLPLILARGGGDIVNIASVAGLKASPGFAVYSASKYAVRGFTDSLRMELRDRGVRVLCVNPGMTQTAFFERFGSAPAPPQEGQRLMPPEHVAAAIVEALALPAATAVNELTIRPSWQER
ncbi:MAG: SDR family NAD(P)-dependent oxidoreductase [Desulfarculus sp.]|nr:MAG: SDR family NAD(P)-dependent oxidoreductase [Desulfarculus sp.]